MKNATVTNLIPVIHAIRDIQGQRVEFLTISVPEGWEDVKKLCKKVLDFEGTKFTFSGWNSDRNECFFRQATSFASIVS